jgi:DNA gyrase/topoisomerase IV subunit A
LVIASLDKNDKLQWYYRCTDHDDILFGFSNVMTGRFPASTLRPTGRTSRGVISMKLREGDTIADMNVLAPSPVHSNEANEEGKEFVLFVTEQGCGKRVSTNDFRCTSRGKLGVIAMKFKKQMKEEEKEDKMSGFCIVRILGDNVRVTTINDLLVAFLEHARYINHLATVYFKLFTLL